PGLNQVYEALKRRCLETGRLFRDDAFPALGASLGFNELGPNSYKVRGVSWRRPMVSSDSAHLVGSDPVLCQNPVNRAHMEALREPDVGPSGSIRTSPEPKSHWVWFRPKRSLRFWTRLDRTTYKCPIDSLITHISTLIITIMTKAKGRGFWSALLDKAYTKLFSSQSALSGGSTTEGFEDFTGGIAEVHELTRPDPHLFHIIQKALGRGSLMGRSIDITNSPDSEAITSQKLVKGHAYSVTGADQVEYQGDTDLLIWIRNPWGQVEWTGTWSDKGSDGLDPTVRTRNPIRNVPSEASEMIRLTLCDADGAASTMRTESVSEHPAVQIFIGLDCRSRETSGGTRQSLTSERQEPSILLQVPDEFSGQMNVHLDRNFFVRHASAVRSETFINLREVCSRFVLPPGEYLIVPSTFEPNKDGDFCIQVFSEKQADFQVLEDPVESRVEKVRVLTCDDVDDRFRRLFGQLAGQDCEISAFELQRILNKVVTKPLNLETKGWATLCICRNMVNLLDKDGCGKLGLVKFKILWTKIENFLTHVSPLCSRISTGPEMWTAVDEAGFNLNSLLYQVLVARYSELDLTVDFDNFVSCLVRLETMFDLFARLDMDGSRTVELGLMEVPGCG
uniref:Calpain 2, (m/II) large subunit, like n=1 Tax=Poecilia formosa TaxID=48698 RepID=A0A087YL75_POEFO